MKKYIAIVAAVLCLFASQNGMAREISGYGIRGVLGLPSGTFGDLVGTGFGGVGTLFYSIDENLVLTGSAGFLRFGGDGISKDFNWSVIPLMSGARYYLGEEDAGMRPYVGGDLGYFIVNVSGDNGLVGIGGSEVTLGPAVGVQLNSFDIRAIYYLTDIAYLGLEVGIALRK